MTGTAAKLPVGQKWHLTKATRRASKSVDLHRKCHDMYTGTN